MNIQQLDRALYALRSRLVNDNASRSDIKDAAEMICVASRVMRGTPFHKAMGAPGDWGYGTPIGDALAAKPAPEVPAFNERDCSGVFDGNQVISDADPGL